MCKDYSKKQPINRHFRCYRDFLFRVCPLITQTLISCPCLHPVPDDSNIIGKLFESCSKVIRRLFEFNRTIFEQPSNDHRTIFEQSMNVSWFYQASDKRFEQYFLRPTKRPQRWKSARNLSFNRILFLIRKNMSGNRLVNLSERDKYGNYVPSILSARYDALIYLDKTIAIHPHHLGANARKLPESYPFGL